MTSPAVRFPDLYRYARAELKPLRLALGAGATFIAGVCACAASLTDKARPMETFFAYILGMQAIVLLGYGTSRVANSIMQERHEGTWDLQRLTPLSPLELAVGKLVGAPLFAFYLAAAFLPWTLLALLIPGHLAAAVVLRAYAALASGALMALSLGLVISAYGAESTSGVYSSSTGTFAGFFAVLLFLTIGLPGVRGSYPSLSWLGHPWSLPALWTVSASALGLWSFLGAKWRIGKDFLEGPRWWRLPAFLLFLVGYELSLMRWDRRDSLPFLVLPPALFVYMAAVLNPDGVDRWRRWIGGGGAAGDPHEIPAWVNGAVFFALLCGVTTAAIAPPRFDAVLTIGLGQRLATLPEPAWTLYPALQCAYLVRDLAFLQWCRLSVRRRPEVVALSCIGAAYLIPAVIAGSIENAGSCLFLYAPVPSPAFGWAANLGPGLAQAAAMLWLAWRRLRPTLRPA